MSWQVGIFAILGAVLIGGFAWYERSRPPSQIVALVAALAALAVAGRLVLAPIPNVVATTDVALLSGFALGAAPGFVVGALAGLISNFWLGQGPWTPWQMAGWGLAGVLGALLAWATRRRGGRLELAAACGFAGLAYGALLNFSLMVSYGGELTFERWLVLEGRAVPFDLAHTIGNITLALVAGPAMVKMLIRFRERFEFRWPKQAGGQRRPGLTGSATVLLAGLITLMALAVPTATARPSSVGWLERAANADGGFPAAGGGESSTQMTGWAMLGLEAAGTNPLDIGRRGRTPVAYLRRNVAEVRTPGDLARTVLALNGAGVDPRRFGGRDLVARLAGRRRANGSYQGWPNSTAFAVMALRSSGAGANISRSLAWLRRVQAAEGGWGAVPGAGSDPDSTGAVLQALRGESRAATRGIRFLRRSQVAGGGWSLTPSSSANAQSTAWAIQGLLAAGVDPATVRRGGRSGLDYLAARRGADGHYRYSPSSDQTPVWVTGQALAAAKMKAFPLAAVPRASAPAGTREGSRSDSESSGAGESRSASGPKRDSSENETRPPRPQSDDRGEPPAKEETGAPPVAQEVGGTMAVSDTSPGRESDDGSTPLTAIGIGVALAAAVLGGGVAVARRFG